MIFRFLAVSREAWLSARSQPIASLVTVAMVAGMILSVMLTTGRTVGAEQQVLGAIDTAGTRAIQVRAEDGAGLTAGVLDRIQNIEGIEWAAALSSATDATNLSVLDGARVPTRLAYGTQLDRLGLPDASRVRDDVAYASPRALELLGLPDAAGAITTSHGRELAVMGEITPPDFLGSLEPIIFVPQPDASGDEVVNVLIVIAERPDLVAPVSAAVLSVLAVDDPTMISVQTSETLAELRAIVQTQLGTFSRGLVLVTLAITGVLVAVILYGLVLMRRKDFGRRRALGATRRLIVGLILIQTTMLAVLGVALGLIAAAAALRLAGDPLPGLDFMVALGTLAVATAGGAGLAPAFVASTREPIRELRVP